MRLTFSAVIVALAVVHSPAHAQSEPTSDMSPDAFIEVLTPPERPLTRGLTPQLREEDTPRIDLAVEFEFASHALTPEI